MLSKVFPDAHAALKGILFDGMSIAAGGFGLCGVPEDLVVALRDSNVKDLTVIGNNVGCDEQGMWKVLANNQIRKVLASYVGENKILAERFMNGTIEIEFNPQGTLAERMRAGGAGIPAFYTKTGYGTKVAEGKETRQFNGEWYVMETGIVSDVSLVKAWKGDTEGNLIYRKTARNFNPMIATCGKITVAEVEILVEPGELHPDQIHTPGIFVDRIFKATNYVKHIERLTTTPRPGATGGAAAGGEV